MKRILISDRLQTLRAKALMMGCTITNTMTAAFRCKKKFFRIIPPEGFSFIKKNDLGVNVKRVRMSGKVEEVWKIKNIAYLPTHKSIDAANHKLESIHPRGTA